MSGFAFIITTAMESKVTRLLLSCFLALVVILHVGASRILCQHIVTRYISRKSRASPINIDFCRVLKQNQKPILCWTGYEEMPLAMFLENNGTTVVLHVNFENPPYLSGGDLIGNYYFREAIFKWGLPEHAEHSIGFEKFTLEVQVLHQNVQDLDYITVAYLYVLSSEGNEIISQITENLFSMKNAGSFQPMPPFELDLLMRPFESGYYSYSGTYDNGRKVVPTQWIIHSDIRKVSFSEIVEFKALRDENGQRIECNARSQQPLGNRSVLYY